MQMSDNSHLNLLKNHKNHDIKLSDDLESSVLRNIVCNLGGIDSIIKLCLSNQDYCNKSSPSITWFSPLLRLSQTLLAASQGTAVPWTPVGKPRVLGWQSCSCADEKVPNPEDGVCLFVCLFVFFTQKIYTDCIFNPFFFAVYCLLRRPNHLWSTLFGFPGADHDRTSLAGIAGIWQLVPW